MSLPVAISSSAATTLPQPPKLIIGIDFGTHASGFAFAKPATTAAAAGSGGGASHVRVSTHDRWPDQPSPDAKTRTALHYQKDRVVAWGWTAWKRWGEMTADKRAKDGYSYVENFKLLLKDEKAAGVDTVCPLPPGVTRVQAVADYLAEMRKYIREQLKRTHGVTLHNDETLWCLTVPAIWSDVAKARMRDAAHRAGLLAMKPESLVLTLEPEAAALSAVLLGEDPSALNPTGLQQVGAEGGGDGSTSTATTSVSEGDVLLVLDCGGGTADVTMHRVWGSGAEMRLEEAAEGRGLLAGGAHVDAAVWRHVRILLGPDPWDTWKEAHPAEFASLRATWERCKRSFTYDDLAPASAVSAAASTNRTAVVAVARTSDIRLPLPQGLQDEMGESALRSLSNPRDGRGYVDPDNMELVLPARLVAQRFFYPEVNKITEAMQDVIDDGSAKKFKCTKVLLAGGFARSSYLKSCVSLALPLDATLLTPTDPGAAVVTGAVLFGSSPGAVSTRCCRYSYGVNMGQPWSDEDAISAASTGYPSKKWLEEKKCFYAMDKYERMVKRGELLTAEEAVTHSFCPLHMRQTSVHFELFKTPNNSARYVKEPDMEKLGEVILPLPLGWSQGLSKSEDYQVKVEMRFGATELSLVALDPRTSDAVAVNVMWDMDSA